MTKIMNEEQYEWAVKRVEDLLPITEDRLDDPNMIELEILSNLVADYEDVHYPIERPTMADVIKLRMHEMQLTQKEVADMIGVSASRISQYLSGKAEPTLPMPGIFAISSIFRQI